MKFPEIATPRTYALMCGINLETFSKRVLGAKERGIIRPVARTMGMGKGYIYRYEDIKHLLYTDTKDRVNTLVLEPIHNATMEDEANIFVPHRKRCKYHVVSAEMYTGEPNYNYEPLRSY